MMRELYKNVHTELDRLIPDTIRVYYRGKHVGNVKITPKGKIYVTFRNREDHLFRIFKGYGISVEVLNYLRFNGVKVIRIIERDGVRERLLESEVMDWFKFGEDYRFVMEDGHVDKQKVLSVNLMEVVGDIY